MCLCLAACSAQHASVHAGPAVTPAAAEPSASQSGPTQHIPILDQREVHYADVDGTGHADRITVRWVRFTRRSTGSGVARVTVRFADGQSASREFAVAAWTNFGTGKPAMPPFGTTQIDGVRGREVVIATDNSPASFVAYTVITARHQRLRVLPAPVRTGWFVGAAVGPGGSGFTCHGATLTALESGPGHEDGSGGIGVRYRTVRTTFRWRHNRWHASMRRVTHGHYEAGQWNCAGLNEM
jgi:hypothetical protein